MDASSANLGRALAFALIVPACLWLGLILSTPTSVVSLVGVGVVVLALALPLLLRWHSVLLIGFWNALVVVPFLPGQPPMCVPLAGLSLEKTAAWARRADRRAASVTLNAASVRPAWAALRACHTAWKNHPSRSASRATSTSTPPTDKPALRQPALSASKSSSASGRLARRRSPAIRTTDASALHIPKLPVGGGAGMLR